MSKTEPCIGPCLTSGWRLFQRSTWAAPLLTSSLSKGRRTSAGKNRLLTSRRTKQWLLLQRQFLRVPCGWAKKPKASSHFEETLWCSAFPLACPCPWLVHNTWVHAWLCQALGKDCPEAYTTKALRKGKAADQTTLVKAKLAEAIATERVQGVPRSSLQGLLS